LGGRKGRGCNRKRKGKEERGRKRETDVNGRMGEEGS